MTASLRGYGFRISKVLRRFLAHLQKCKFRISTGSFTAQKKKKKGQANKKNGQTGGLMEKFAKKIGRHGDSLDAKDFESMDKSGRMTKNVKINFYKIYTFFLNQ